MGLVTWCSQCIYCGKKGAACANTSSYDRQPRQVPYQIPGVCTKSPDRKHSPIWALK